MTIISVRKFKPVLGLLLAATLLHAAEALVYDRTHESRVFGETRHYRIFLPPDYETSSQRYPVIYWFHGYGERYNQPVQPGRDYDRGSDYGGDNIANFVATHAVIVVKWDGYNPRVPNETYPRPYNISPVETDRQFPPYFPELVAYIDANYRTVADREHRATAGLSMGGFMSFWVAGKYPQLVSSASNFMGSSEFYVGPRAEPVEYRHDEMHGNYEGLRTRLVMGTLDFIQFYHRRMNLLWDFTRPNHESETFEADHGTPGMAKTLEFHMRAFANPLPPPAVWSHVDVYPNFDVWDWSVVSDRQQPGLTQLQNVSRSGFACSVREWLPGGKPLPDVHLSITSAKLYHAGRKYRISVIRLKDGAVAHSNRTADSEGRLRFELTGEPLEVGVGSGPVLSLSGFQIDNAAWAEDMQPVHLKVTLWNKGSRPSQSMTLHWGTPNPDVRLDPAEVRVPSIAPGGRAPIPLGFTVSDPTREIVKLFAVVAGERLPLEIPVFPPPEPAPDFRIANGQSVTLYQHAVEQRTLILGSGRRFAVLLPDGESWRAAELFTNDACVDLTTRVSDVWSSYDHVGASVKYSLPLVSPDCQVGHLIHFLARVQLPSKPNHRIRYYRIDVPIR